MHTFSTHPSGTSVATTHEAYAPLIVLLGLAAMIFSLVGNILEKQEMYPLFMQSKMSVSSAWHEQLPVSLFFSCASDILVCIYGFFIGDPIVVIYGVVNAVVVACTVLEIQLHERSAAQAGVC